jgi:PmbA protein
MIKGENTNMETIINELRNRLKSYKYDFVISDSYSNNVSYENGNLKKFFTNQSNVISLRIFYKGREGYASISSRDNLEFLVTSALYNSKYGEKNMIMLPPRLQNDLPMYKYFHKMSDINWDMLISKSNELIKKINKIDNKFKVNIDFDSSENKYYLNNSSGLSNHEMSSSFSYSIHLEKINNKSIINIGEGYIYPNFVDEIHKVEKKILKYINYYKNESTIPQGKYNIVLSPSAVSSILNTILIGINGKHIEKKTSPLTDKLNKKLLSEKITLIEDPDIADCIGSAVADDEGTLTTRKELVKEGYINKFIYDITTANRMKTQPTGNGFRGGSAKVNPGLTNLLLLPGQSKIADLKKDLKDYVFVDGFIGGGQSNMLAGDFSATIEPAFYYKNNKIQFRAKDNMIAFNVYDVLKSNIIELSSDIENLGAKKFPFMLLKDINIV